MAQYGHATYIHGGVGAPVGLTVFKTAGGSLGAVPGGFDSHTPLPVTLLSVPCACLLTHRFWRFPKLCFPFRAPKLCFPSHIQKRCISLLRKFYQELYKMYKGKELFVLCILFQVTRRVS